MRVSKLGSRTLRLLALLSPFSKTAARLAFVCAYILFLLAVWNVSSIRFADFNPPTWGWNGCSWRFVFHRHSFEFVSVTIPILGALLRLGWEGQTSSCLNRFLVALVALAGPCLAAAWSHYQAFAASGIVGHLGFSSVYFLSLAVIPYVKTRWTLPWIAGTTSALLFGIVSYDWGLLPRGFPSWCPVALTIWIAAAIGKDNGRAFRSLALAGAFVTLVGTALHILAGAACSPTKSHPLKETYRFCLVPATMKATYLGINWVKSERYGFDPALIYRLDLPFQGDQVDCVSVNAHSHPAHGFVEGVRFLTKLHPTKKVSHVFLVLSARPGFSPGGSLTLKLDLALTAHKMMGGFKPNPATWHVGKATYDVRQLALTTHAPPPTNRRVLRLTGVLNETIPTLPEWVHGNTELADPQGGMSVLVLNPDSGTFFLVPPNFRTDGRARRNSFTQSGSGILVQDFKRSHASERALSRYNAVVLPWDEISDPEIWLAEASVGLFLEVGEQKSSAAVELDLPSSLPTHPASSR